jgi:undecaprenyl-diphosphatase
MSILSLIALLQWDESLFRAIHIGLHRDWLDRLILLISYTGDGHIQIPILLFLAINKKTRAIGLWLIGAFLLSGAIRIAIVKIVSRPRPTNFDFAEPRTWPGGFPGGADGWLTKTFDVIPYGDSSFPSGHTTTSAAIAVMLAWLLADSENAWIGRAACIWALLVAFSRIYVGVHYPADVLAAIALATICSTALYLVRTRGQTKGLSAQSE